MRHRAPAGGHLPAPPQDEYMHRDYALPRARPIGPCCAASIANTLGSSASRRSLDLKLTFLQHQALRASTEVGYVAGARAARRIGVSPVGHDTPRPLVSSSPPFQLLPRSSDSLKKQKRNLTSADHCLFDRSRTPSCDQRAAAVRRCARGCRLVPPATSTCRSLRSPRRSSKSKTSHFSHDADRVCQTPRQWRPASRTRPISCAVVILLQARLLSRHLHVRQ